MNLETIPTPAAASSERELKFMLPGGRVALARRWLDVVCRRDPEYPAADVWTIYYDTPRLTALSAKIDSDYLKLKIRLRWYAEPGRGASGPVFIEAKLRVGTLRRKVRVRAPHPAEEVASWDLQDPRLRALPLLLRAQGVALLEAWSPLLLIRYRRDRFLELVGRTRVSLDSDIAAVAVNRRWLSTLDARSIDPGIVEVKGGSDELPHALRPLLTLGARKLSFSKLLAVYCHVTQTLL